MFAAFRQSGSQFPDPLRHPCSDGIDGEAPVVRMPVESIVHNRLLLIPRFDRWAWSRFVEVIDDVKNMRAVGLGYTVARGSEFDGNRTLLFVRTEWRGKTATRRVRSVKCGEETRELEGRSRDRKAATALIAAGIGGRALNRGSAQRKT